MGRTRMNSIGVLVGNFDTELFFDGHDNLHRVEAVESEVICEVGNRAELLSQVSNESGGEDGVSGILYRC